MLVDKRQYHFTKERDANRGLDISVLEKKNHFKFRKLIARSGTLHTYWN